MNIAHNVERARRRFPDREAILFEGKTLTYAQLDESVSRVANCLAGLGVEKGERVALLLPNIPEFVFAYLGTQKLGAIAVSLNSLLKSDEVRFILEDSEPKVVVTTEGARANVPEDALGEGARVVIAEGESGNDLSLHELMAQASSHASDAAMEPQDPAAILYTSGTTGFPKGATLSHGNVISNVHATRHCTDMSPDDRLLLYLPLFHCFGQNFILNSGLSAGATVVLQRRFVLEDVLEALSTLGVTMFFGVPTVFIQLLNGEIPREVFASTRYFLTAAAPMPSEIAGAWQERYGQTIWEGYGLTETSPFASYNHEIRYKLGSIGEPIENVEMRVVDEADNEVEPGVWGEIIIRGPNVMLGYWNRPEATGEAIKDGWFHSGDIGVVDDEGYFSICDRLKDMIITSGFNVYPAEVENVLYSHPQVAEAAVYGAPDPVRGELVKASVVLRTEGAASEQDLEEFCRQKLAGYKVPRVVELVDEIPKGATGKVLKRVLRGDEISPG